MSINFHKVPYLNMPVDQTAAIGSDIEKVQSSILKISDFASIHQPYNKGVGLRMHWNEFTNAKGYTDLVYISDDLCLRVYDATPDAEFGVRYLGEDWLKIDFVASGKTSLVFNDYGQVDLTGGFCAINLHRGDIAKGEWLKSQTPMTGITLFCKPSFLSRTLEDVADDLGNDLKRFIREDTLDFLFETAPFTQPMAAAVHDVLSAPYFGALRKIFVEAKAMELISALAHSLSDHTVNSASSGLSTADTERLYEAKDILTAEFIDPPTIVTLARRVGVNQQKLKCGFKELFDDTIFEYCQKLRLRMASELLLGSHDTITTIAHSVGYDYSCNFSTAFRRHYGVSPKDYRKVS